MSYSDGWIPGAQDLDELYYQIPLGSKEAGDHKIVIWNGNVSGNAASDDGGVVERIDELSRA